MNEQAQSVPPSPPPKPVRVRALIERRLTARFSEGGGYVFRTGCLRTVCFLFYFFWRTVHNFLRLTVSHIIGFHIFKLRPHTRLSGGLGFCPRMRRTRLDAG